MPQFLSISYFRDRVAQLLKVKRGVYVGIVNEIKNSFSNATMSQILSNRDMILIEDAFIVVKLRLPDSKQHLSRSNGYRLIYMAFKETEKVVFLDIYPKRGPLQQINITASDLLSLLKIYAVEAANDSLKIFDVDTPDDINNL